MEKQRVEQILKKLRRKIWTERIIDWIINGLAASAVCITIFMIFTHLYTLVYGLKKSLYIFASIMIVALIIGFLKRPKLKETAILGDRLGLNDRLITYLEYREKNTPFIEVFLEDLDFILKNCNFHKKYKLKIGGKKLFLGILLLCISFGIYYLPTENREIVKEKEEINKILKEEASEIKKVIEEEIALDEHKDIQREARDVLKKLEKNLKDTFDFNEAAAEITEAQREAQNIFKKDEEDILEALSGVFQGASAASGDFKNALKSQDIENAIELSKDRTFTHKEQEKILESLKLEEERPHTSRTKEKLNTIKRELENKTFTGNSLKKVLKSSNKSYAMENVEKEILTKLQESKERFLAKSDSGMKNKGGQDRLSTFAEGKETDLSSGETGSREGNELLAGGFGNKAVNSSEGVGGGGSAAYGEGRKTEVFGKQQKNTDTNRLGDAEVSISQITGQKSQSGDITNKFSNEVLAIEGERKDLEGVFMEYRKEGMKYIYRQNIPLGRRELIMKYFTSINGGKANGEENN